MLTKNLIYKRDKLLKDNQMLKEEYAEKVRISKLNDEIASQSAIPYKRGGKYASLPNHPEYNTKWKGTFFDTQRPLIESLNAWPLNRLGVFQEGNIDNPFGDPLGECSGSLIGYCDMVAPSKYGPVIRITDPFGSVTFPPLVKTPFEVAINWVGRILIVDALYQHGRKNPKVTHVKVLSFTLFDNLRKSV